MRNVQNAKKKEKRRFSLHKFYSHWEIIEKYISKEWNSFVRNKRESSEKKNISWFFLLTSKRLIWMQSFSFFKYFLLTSCNISLQDDSTSV